LRPPDTGKAVTYIHAKIINVLKSNDGKTRVDLLERDDGLFEFRTYVECYEIGGPYDGEPYWSPTVNSGLYASIEDAERDANEALASVTRTGAAP
jgi:hypothetical protein